VGSSIYSQSSTELSADSLLKLSQQQIYKDPDLAAEYAMKAVEIAQQNEEPSQEALGYIFLGVIGEIQADYEKGFDYLNKARDVAREHDLPHREGLAVMNMGNLHFRLENFDFAIRYFMDANRIFQSSGNQKFTGAVLNNLAIIYEEYEDYENALQYLDSAEAIYLKLEGDVDERRISESRARIFTFMGEPERAIPILESNLKANQRDSLNFDLSLNYFNYGKAELALGDTVAGLRDYRKALELFDDLGMHRESGESNREISKLLSKSEQYASALEHMKAAIDNFEEAKDTKRLQQAYNLYGDILLEMNRKLEALDSYRLANRWDDTLRVRNNERMRDRLQISRNSEKQREELFQAQVENKVLEQKADSRKNWLTITSLLLGVLVVLAVWLFFSLKQKQRYLSSLKSLNEKNASQNLELAELNKVKTRMFTIIGHDLRSPLASLHGSLQLINAGKMTEEEKSMMLVSLSEAVTHTKVTIDNLFHWAKEEMDGGTAQKKVFDLSDVIDDTLPLYDWMMKQKGISFEHSCDESIPVFADRDQLRFVLRNLVHNSFKFTPKGGEVEVTCSKNEKGSSTIVEVKDTGIGIPKENLEALKAGVDVMSSRGTQQELGSGLGLKMCYTFIEQNGGELEVESSEDKGTVFRIVLPATSEARA